MPDALMVLCIAAHQNAEPQQSNADQRQDRTQTAAAPQTRGVACCAGAHNVPATRRSTIFHHVIRFRWNAIATHNWFFACLERFSVTSMCEV